MAFRKSTGNAGQRAAEIFKTATDYASESSKKPSLMLKLFRGEIKLILSFWTFFVSIPLLGDLIFSQLIFPMLDVTSAVGTAAVFVWGTLMLVYGIIASIGLWRAAKVYAGPRHWAVLSQIAAVLGIAGAVAYAVMWYATWMILANA